MKFALFILLVVPAVFADAPDFQKVIKEGQEKFDQAMDELKQTLGLSKNPNGEEIVKLVKNKNEQLAKEITELRKNVEEKIKNNPDAKAAVDGIKGKLKEASDKLKKENPEIAKNAEKLEQTLKSTFDSVAQEIEKSYKEFSKKGGKQDEIENFFKDLIDKGTNAAKELNENIQEAIKEKKN